MSQLSRLVILISGSGTNLQAVLDACADGTLPAQVVAVYSNKPDAYGLVRARQAGVPAIAFPKQEGETRQDYDRRLAESIESLNPSFIVLAGWMRLLSMEFLGRFPQRVINLHPALPGTFPGTHAIERAYEAWTKGEIDRSGVMVHLVPDEGVDAGPVLGTEEIPFRAGELLEQFESRVHEVEHRLLVETLVTILNTKGTKDHKVNP